MRTGYRQMRCSRKYFLIAFAIVLLFAAGCAQPLTNEAVEQAAVAVNQDRVGESAKQEVKASPPASAGLTLIEVTYKLDPRITSGVYMGDRWVSPPTYDTVQIGEIFTVEAAAKVLGADGRALQIEPEWIAADPDMVTVLPGQGNEVTIKVKGAGESSLEVTSEGASKILLIKASIPQDNAIRVAISQ